jgi:hypothetical protein
MLPFPSNLSRKTKLKEVAPEFIKPEDLTP